MQRQEMIHFVILKKNPLQRIKTMMHPLLRLWLKKPPAIVGQNSKSIRHFGLKLDIQLPLWIKQEDSSIVASQKNFLP